MAKISPDVYQSVKLKKQNVLFYKKYDTISKIYTNVCVRQTGVRHSDDHQPDDHQFGAFHKFGSCQDAVIAGAVA